jgi:hypothetical protein
MAHFYGSMVGDRGEVTRRGSKNSGLHAHVRGWDSGVSVSAVYNAPSGRNIFTIGITGGSNNSSVIKDLGTFTVQNGKVVKID